MSSLESMHLPEEKPLFSSDGNLVLQRRKWKAQPSAARLFPPRNEGEISASKVEGAGHTFLRVVENREKGGFDAEFAFRLVGIVCNGYTRNNLNRFHEAVSTNGDRLAARLLPLLGINTEARFIFQGGGDTNLNWSIGGAIREAPTREDAIAQAMLLRASVQMLLGSEPIFSFKPGGSVYVEDQREATSLWRTDVLPRTVSLAIPYPNMMGFGRVDCPTEAPERILRMAVPRAEKSAFRSLAEAVILNPEPIALQVDFVGFVLDERTRTAITEASRWTDKHPVQFQAQLVAARIDPSLSENIQEHLRKWLQNPTGTKVRCRIFSSKRPSNCFVEMVGGDVFSSRVDGISGFTASEHCVAEKPLAKAGKEDVDLGCCLHADARWPSLFPSLESISRARVQRLFNHEGPSFGEQGIVLGQVAETSRESARLPDAARPQHLYILGATGTGKSTLLFNLILQDIRSGRGVGVIDPHGDLYDQLLEAMPLSRAGDVVLFNPGQSDSSPGINPLECHGPNRSLQVSFIINDLLKTFERLYDMRLCGGPVFETYFRNAMLLLMESGLEDVTLTEFPLVFEDSDYRKFLKGRCKNPLVVSFWNHQAEKAKGDWALENMAGYIVSKINAFISNALIRPIVGQAKSTIDFRRVLDNRQIMLIRLSKGMLGELDTELLGSFILSKIFATAMGRAAVKTERRSIFHLYVDEFQNFTNDSVAHMLSEARKYGLYLTLANQNLSQLHANPGRQNVLESVLGNVGSLVTFRVGPADAERLLPYTQPEFDREDLQSLPNFHAVGRVLTEKGPTRPFVFRTLGPNPESGYALAKPEVWQLRENHYTRPLAEVEAQILKRRTLHKSKQEPGSRGKATTAEVLGCLAGR